MATNNIFGAGGVFGSQGSIFGNSADASIASGGPPLASPTAAQTGILGLGGSGLTAGGVSTVFNDLGGVASSLLASSAYTAEAGAYGAAAGSALGEVQATEVLGQLEKFKLQRQISLTESGQTAEAAKQGLVGSTGSAADLLRESVTQGNLAQGALTYQTELKAGQYQEQAYAAQEQEKAANSAAGGALFGGALKGVAGIASLALML